MKKLIRELGSNWTVQQKGLFLVGVPLIFQLILTVVLGFLYSQAEQQAWEESQARLLMVRSNTLLASLYSAGQMLVVYTAHPTEEVYSLWLSQREKMIEDMDSIKQLTIARGDSSMAYRRMLAISNRGVKLLEVSYRRAHEGSRFNLFQAFPAVKEYLDGLTDEVQLVLTDDMHNEVNRTLRQESTRKLMATILYAGVVVDVVLAVVLSIFFSASIVSRLSVITDNTKKLRTRTKLNDQLRGSDEIAQLDTAFHNLSDDLKTSEQLRSEFVAMVSHDLRTPLMSVELSMQQVQAKLAQISDIEVQDELRSTERNIKRVMNLIRDLLDLERGAAGKLNLEIEELSVKELFERVIGSLRAFAEQKQVVLASSCGEESIFADQRRIDQVLMNLTSNALKFAPPGSTVELGTAKAGSEVELVVSDQGPGIPEKDREHIFQRFVQAESAPEEVARSGFGLGLAICKTIVESHEGSIGYKPNTGGGSQFWIKLKSAD